MAASDSLSQRLKRRFPTCANCAAPLADDQRYCVACGTRRGPMPGVAGGLITALTGEARDAQAAAEPGADRWFTWPDLNAITPRIAAVAVMSMLAFGVVVGSGANSLANSGGRSLLLALSHPGTTVASVVTPAGTGGSAGSGAGGGGGSGPNAGPTVVTQTVTAQTVTAPGASSGGGGPSAATPAPVGPTLPPVRHVFEIVLSGQGYNQVYGATSPLPYLATTLRKQGELLQNYYAVAPSPLSNAIALISGQGPNPQTASDCPQYTAFVQTGTDKQQQALGSGCVFATKTQTIGDQLTAAGLTWKAYLEGMHAAAATSGTTSTTGSGTTSSGTTTSGTPSSAPTPADSPSTSSSGTSTSATGARTGNCQHPALGAEDPNSSPSAASPYVTYRNPFGYFQSLSAACPTRDVDLSQLSTDLKSETSTPSLSYIVPGQCDDGSGQSCVPGQPANPQAADAATEAFLRSVIPAIEKSPAYKGGGLIAITFDAAPQSGPNADHSSCCQTPPYPNMPQNSSSSSTTTTAAGTSSTAAATSTVPLIGSSSTATTSGTPSSTATTSGSPTTSSTTTPAGSPGAGSPTTSGPSSAPVGSGESTPTGGGGQVGLLLISKFVKPNTLDSSNYYNHYSLLASIESLFSLTRLAFASNLSLPVFDRVTYNAWTR